VIKCECGGSGKPRFCVACQAHIHECMGFVKAGDVLDFWQGIRKEFPRELCGKCVEWFDWTASGELVRRKHSKIYDLLMNVGGGQEIQGVTGVGV